MEDDDFIAFTTWQEQVAKRPPNVFEDKTIDAFEDAWETRIERVRAHLTALVPKEHENNALIAAEIARRCAYAAKDKISFYRSLFEESVCKECRRAIQQKVSRADKGAVVHVVQVDFNTRDLTVLCFKIPTEEQTAAFHQVARNRGLNQVKVQVIDAPSYKKGYTFEYYRGVHEEDAKRLRQ